MRIGIVNDLPIAVEALRRVLASVPEYEVAWIAVDGAEAVERCRCDRPDMVLMDLIMPVMDGVEATRRIMLESPCAILVVTATVDGNISKVFDAMGYGALDAVNTPATDKPGGADNLLKKIAIVGQLIDTPYLKTAAMTGGQPERKTASRDEPFVVAIGASTGGPAALCEIAAALPGDFNAAVVIVQHVDKAFAPGLVTWLRDKSSLPVALAEDNAALQPGSIIVAGTNDHLVMTASQRVCYTPDPPELNYRPSVNVFFHSLAVHWAKPGVAVLLTGMGQDGGDGLLTLRQQQWHTIAQDEATSVVYGMPKAAAELNAAKEILPVDRIAPAIINAWKTSTKG